MPTAPQGIAWIDTHAGTSELTNEALAEDKQDSAPRGLTSAEIRDIWERAELDDLLDGASRQEFVLRFTISHPDVHTTIVGTVDASHLEDNLVAARKGSLPADVYAESKRRLSASAHQP